jgi:DNA-binding NtrC family response regulator
MNILIVDDQKELREQLAQMMVDLHHQPFLAENGREALRLLQNYGRGFSHSIHLVLLDVQMPDLSGLETLREIKRYDPSIGVLMITAHGNIKDAVESMRYGAYNYIEKPVQQEHIQEMIDQASLALTLLEDFNFASPELTSPHSHDTQTITSTHEILSIINRTQSPVLILGEKGTGKARVARALHLHSERKNKNFIKFECQPQWSLKQYESEFFGHEKDALTGNEPRKIGLLQLINEGTLTLEKCEYLPELIWNKILHAYQHHCFSPLGSDRELQSDFNLILSVTPSAQPYYLKLENFNTLKLKPLRERKEDISNLVKHLIHQLNQSQRRIDEPNEIRGIQSDALEALKSQPWTLNINELVETIRQAYLLEDSHYLQLKSFKQLKTKIPQEPFASRPLSIDFHTEKEKFEKEFILQALKLNHGRINQTVAEAGIPKNTLLRKMRKYGIKANDPVDS